MALLRPALPLLTLERLYVSDPPSGDLGLVTSTSWLHKVPLTEPVLAILEKLDQIATGPFVFAAPGAVKPFGVNGMLQVLARFGLKGKVTTHGFRSCLEDWSAETTAFAAEVREMCLAHAIPSAVEAAYPRGDLFAKRRQLMEQWARFCTSPAPDGEVVPFTATSRSA
jgi:integrase